MTSGALFSGCIAMDHPGQPRADDEALPRRALGLAEQGAPRQPAMLAMGDSQHLPRAPGTPVARPLSTASPKGRGVPSAPGTLTRLACAGATSRPS